MKQILEIDPNNTVEDARLLWWIEQLSNWIEELLGRDLSYKVRTQYVNGTGTQKLLLKNRPVYPVNNPYPSLPFEELQVWTDSRGYYGSAPNAFNNNPPNNPLTYGRDYCLVIDQDDGSSRSAILLAINRYWYRPYARQAGLLTPFMVQDMGSIKVTYTAGWTVDTLPAVLRLALDQMVAQTRNLFPLGSVLASESYEDRAIAYLNERRDALIAIAKPLMWSWRNWSFGL